MRRVAHNIVVIIIHVYVYIYIINKRSMIFDHYQNVVICRSVYETNVCCYCCSDVVDRVYVLSRCSCNQLTSMIDSDNIIMQTLLRSFVRPVLGLARVRVRTVRRMRC